MVNISVKNIIKNLKKNVVSFKISNLLIIRIKKVGLIKSLEILKRIFKFDLLVDILVVEKNKSYELLYVISNSRKGLRICIEISVSKKKNICCSVENLYNSGNWLEREIKDMHGIYFMGNYDLRRLLLDYGFEGNPLNKSYPVVGFIEIRYDGSSRRLRWYKSEYSKKFIK